MQYLRTIHGDPPARYRQNSLPRTGLPLIATLSILVKFRRLCSARLDLRQVASYSNRKPVHSVVWQGLKHFGNTLAVCSRR